MGRVAVRRPLRTVIVAWHGATVLHPIATSCPATTDTIVLSDEDHCGDSAGYVTPLKFVTCADSCAVCPTCITWTSSKGRIVSVCNRSCTVTGTLTPGQARPVTAISTLVVPVSPATT